MSLDLLGMLKLKDSHFQTNPRYQIKFIFTFNRNVVGEFSVVQSYIYT